jgi:nitroimidazol reductase NimA-like FMN-containing flavoprotein (pyridoxamine 5'-phosphate oxidase superfamily)
LSHTDRTTIHRHGDRARHDRAELLELLDSVLVCHLGLVRDGHPLVLPTIFAVDPDGPDLDGTVYLHGSVAARSLVDAPGSELCLTWTAVDALVLARSGFHHSMNYRSAVLIGTGRLVTDPAEKRRALDLVVDHVVPGRAQTLRDHHRKELAATSVVAVSLREVSMKQRTGPPVDDREDVEAGIWAGLLPLRATAGEPVSADDAAGVAVPADVQLRAQALG